jgi:hypothetical protein
MSAGLKPRHFSTHVIRLALCAACFVVVSAASAFAQLSGVASSEPVPDALSPSVKALLETNGVKATSGASTLEFWWASHLPVSGGSASWSGVTEGALVGAVRITGAFREIRGRTIKPGVYTLRYGLQPQNGDHLGASPFREFLLVSPAAADVDPEPLGFDAVVALSKQTTGVSHPASLSIDPPAATAPVLSVHTSELGHKGLIVEVKTPRGPLRFGLILVGLIEA